MTKQEFLYQYLVIYNEYEKDFEGKDAVSYWKNKDQNESTSGLLFMAIRNALVHNTEETISKIEEESSFTRLLTSLKKCTLNYVDKVKYLNILLYNEKVISDLKNKDFKLINVSSQKRFKLFQRKVEGFYATIFFSHENQLFDTSVSTYNHIDDCKDYYNGYYIESEVDEETYLIKFFKDDNRALKDQIFIQLDLSFNPKKVYQSIQKIKINYYDEVETRYKVIEKDRDEVDKLDHSEVKDLLDQFASDEVIRKAAKIIRDGYKELNQFLHVIGFQNIV